jgi:hypothetical protein
MLILTILFRAFGIPASKTFYLFGFPIFWLWAYLMKVITYLMKVITYLMKVIQETIRYAFIFIHG